MLTSVASIQKCLINMNHCDLFSTNYMIDVTLVLRFQSKFKSMGFH